MTISVAAPTLLCSILVQLLQPGVVLLFLLGAWSSWLMFGLWSLVGFNNDNLWSVMQMADEEVEQKLVQDIAPRRSSQYRLLLTGEPLRAAFWGTLFQLPRYNGFSLWSSFISSRQYQDSHEVWLKISIASSPSTSPVFLLRKGTMFSLHVSGQVFVGSSQITSSLLTRSLSCHANSAVLPISKIYIVGCVISKVYNCGLWRARRVF